MAEQGFSENLSLELDPKERKIIVRKGVSAYSIIINYCVSDTLAKKYYVAIYLADREPS